MAGKPGLAFDDRSVERIYAGTEKSPKAAASATTVLSLTESRTGSSGSRRRERGKKLNREATIPPSTLAPDDADDKASSSPSDASESTLSLLILSWA